MAPSNPNVVLITCHDLGRYLGCYGAAIETPRLDELAESGALLENHFVTAPQCSPSRGSFMTGRFPHVNGLMGLAHGDWELHEGERILPHYLDDAGYETHLFGLQHITQDTDRLEYDYVHSEGNLYPGVSPAVHQANRARNVAEVVSGFLEREAFESPFFASIGFFELHRVEEENGRFGFDSDHYETDDPDAVRPLTFLPDRRGIRQDLAEMHGMVRAVDDAVGSILDTLAETGLDEETLVVFTTEHGIAFPRAKGSCYDPGIEAALLLRCPDVADDGSRYDELLSNVDVLPTILDLIGDEDDDLETPAGLDGRSFLPLLTGDDYEPRERIFAEMTWHDMYNPVRTIRTKRYKYVRNFWHLPKVYLTTDVFASEAGRMVRETDAVPPRPYEELYDLEESPQEDDNVVFEPKYQGIRERLARELHEWMGRTDDPLLDGPVVPGDYETITSWPHKSNSDTV
ncbi:sulfatase family protein [Natronobacterium gregoryi]|uniref:Sulfatase n=2 Tax=Natronobacterium gregoryi TaxID=44930 RepID=L0AE38_NATGS|nr:sulfatase [Natronobacterium gregoryi]AFZ71689.1 arylsulfatase A family protein [Natronobacterium gregoryi SP2]ELY72739.1 sulfatase [Natronobacterium gregoryi SP2]PLK20263.1 sulfatase [Natronobacterium gregoryi SP2]SFJ25275.1 Arylsulfatase A [Natronobacterium gregoryi]